MQANWMQQREAQSGESKVKGQRTTATAHQSRQSKKTNGASKKEGNDDEFIQVSQH